MTTLATAHTPHQLTAPLKRLRLSGILDTLGPQWGGPWYGPSKPLPNSGRTPSS